MAVSMLPGLLVPAVTDVAVASAVYPEAKEPVTGTGLAAEAGWRLPLPSKVPICVEDVGAAALFVPTLGFVAVIDPVMGTAPLELGLIQFCGERGSHTPTSMDVLGNGAAWATLKAPKRAPRANSPAIVRRIGMVSPH